MLPTLKIKNLDQTVFSIMEMSSISNTDKFSSKGGTAHTFILGE